MNRLSRKEQAFLVKQLSYLLRSGMSVPQSLRLLAEDARGYAKNALNSIATLTEEGSTLSSALERTPSAVGPFAIAAIRVGEESGTLERNLNYLADELTKQADLRAKLLGSLIYPALITTATIALTLGLIVFIFPKILPVFSGLSLTLPLSTRIVLAIDSYLRTWGLVTLIILGIATAGMTYAVRRYESVRIPCERFALMLPLIGGMLRLYAVRSGTRTLAVLIESGMPLPRALATASDMTPFLVYRETFRLMAQSVSTGGALGSRAREYSNLFPSAVAQMIATGEGSGTLIETLTYVSDYCAGEVEERAKRLTNLVEPVLMLCMGSLVAFVAISMLMPMYEITQHLHAR